MSRSVREILYRRCLVIWPVGSKPEAFSECCDSFQCSLPHQMMQRDGRGAVRRGPLLPSTNNVHPGHNRQVPDSASIFV